MNAIVYSLHSDEGDLTLNYNFVQLKKSVETLRQYNKKIPVLVYASPIEAIPKYGEYPLTTVTFVGFDVEWDKRLEHETYARWTSHKWKNSFHALEKYKFDNVLYVDTDTFFQGDPEKLFREYGGTSFIVGKKDISEDWTKVFDVKRGGMNDGQYLLSKKTLEYKDELLKERVEYVLRLQERYKKSKDKDLKDIGIQWVSCQYAVSEFLNKIGKPLQFFKDTDVYIIYKIEEFESLPKEISDKIILIHYLNYNMHRYCPEAYESYKKAREKQ